jgi:hypothetical protein
VYEEGVFRAEPPRSGVAGRRKIAFLQLGERCRLPDRRLHPRQNHRAADYPKPGDPCPKVRVGVICHGGPCGATWTRPRGYRARPLARTAERRSSLNRAGPPRFRETDAASADLTGSPVGGHGGRETFTRRATVSRGARTATVSSSASHAMTAARTPPTDGDWDITSLDGGQRATSTSPVSKSVRERHTFRVSERRDLGSRSAKRTHAATFCRRAVFLRPFLQREGCVSSPSANGGRLLSPTSRTAELGVRAARRLPTFPSGQGPFYFR